MSEAQPIKSGYRQGPYPWRGVPVIHMVAGEGILIPCLVDLSDDNTHVVTTKFEDVTCVECRVGWLTYERDQYKEMWEKATSEKDAAQEDNGITREELTELIKTAVREILDERPTPAPSILDVMDHFFAGSGTAANS